MQKPKNVIIIYSLIAVTSLSTYFFVRMQNLKKELQGSKAKVEVTEHSLKVYQSLATIDSMLFNGQYDEALQAYQDQQKTGGEWAGRGIAQRIKLAQQIIGSKRVVLGKPDSADSVDIQGDSVVTNPSLYATSVGVRQYDSMSFALAKAKLQVQNLKRQLQQKSSGEYLTFTTSKGKKVNYVGEVKNKKANGRGVALLVTGSRYEGEWKDNHRHGNGAFYWPDGQYYVGNYQKDKRHGQGTYYWPNKEKYIGLWANDQRNGEGVFYGKDGKVIASGIWKDDKLVEVKK